CGFFTWKGLGCSFLILSMWWTLEWRYLKAIPFGSLFRRYLLFCLCVGALVAGQSRWMKAYEAVILGNDSSVYIASAFQLANSGRMIYNDPFVTEANPQEQQAIFYNPLFPRDPTGKFVRFPYGIHLIDRTKGTVSFSFYPLFPSWLAFGL